MEEPGQTSVPEGIEQEDWEDDDDYNEEEEDEDDADIDAEALEIARRLGEELWADISKVTAERNAVATGPPTDIPSANDTQRTTHNHFSHEQQPPPLPLGTHIPRKEEAIVATMKTILTLLENDPLAKSTLASATLPSGQNVLDVLMRCTIEGNITKGLAGPLSQVIVSFARSNTLFGNLKQSNASAIQLDRGKRKREEFDEGHHMQPHAYKRPYVPDVDLHNQVVEAVRIIAQALGTTPPSEALDPSLVSSIRLQLHQVFLFAVTSSATGGPSMHALQEISGLIQVVGVLSGIQIGQSESRTHPSGQPYGWNSGRPSTMPTDIGTAVYPCLVAGCNKTFSRLYSLRAHQRGHTSHRPYRCTTCPGSFARNHDLKRHVKLHDKKAWKCEGCQKIFSRRDAIKRHKTGTKHRGPKSEICLLAEVIEVQLEDEEGEDAIREERRAKLWNGIVVQEASGASSTAMQKASRDVKTIDEGEINPAVISRMQASVMGLHGLLQALVGNALGNPTGYPPLAPIDPSAGQATLASVIARAQTQTIASGFLPSSAAAQSSSQMSNSVADTELMGGDENPVQPQTAGESPESHPPIPSLSMYGLSDEQAQLLEVAIANAASAAQAQAEAEAALEEEEEEEEGDYDQDDNDYDDSDMEQDKEVLE